MKIQLTTCNFNRFYLDKFLILNMYLMITKISYFSDVFVYLGKI